MPINYQQLRTFHAIASDRSMSRAARRLGVSQPTLSKQLKELQEHHGIRVFTGNRPPLGLTEAGATLFEKTKRLFAVAEDIAALLEDVPTTASDLLRICSDSPSAAAALLARLATAAPQLRCRVAIENAAQANHQLMTGGVDVAIVHEPLDDPDYVHHKIHENRLVALVPGIAAPRDRVRAGLRRNRDDASEGGGIARSSRDRGAAWRVRRHRATNRRAAIKQWFAKR